MIDALILHFLLVLSRVAGFLTFVPLFRRVQVPRLVKVGLACALTMLWHPTLPDLQYEIAARLGWPEMAFLVARELFLGAGFGFVMGLLLESARMAGAYLGQELGLSLASVADPQSGQTNGIMGVMFESVAFVLFLSLNLHHVLLYALHLSFASFPVAQGWQQYPFANVAEHASVAHRLAMLIAAPAGIFTFLIMIVLGLLARAVPQMNIFSVGLAVRVGLGLVAILLFLPPMLGVMIRVLERSRLLLDTFL